MKVYVETERFFLREILLTDSESLYELDSDPEVHRYLGNNPITNNNQAIDAIHFIRNQYITNGIGRWAIIDKQTNEFIGWAGLKLVTDLTNNHINYYDLGYRLMKKYWRKGIGTEVSIGLLNYAFNVLKLNEVYAMVDCENEGSNKILNKIGFSLIEKFKLDNVEHNWYKIQQKVS